MSSQTPSPSQSRSPSLSHSPLPTPALSATSTSTSPPSSTLLTPTTGTPRVDVRLGAATLDLPPFELDGIGVDLKSGDGDGEGERDAEVEVEVEVVGQRKVPECWGHRGGSQEYPENTRASFVAACAAGAHGLETDIHVTSDHHLVLFHDPSLGSTTTGDGKIKELPWVGCIEHVRTKKEPSQPIPLFREVLEVLLIPENMGVKLNLDCKVDSDPEVLYPLVRKELERFDGWEITLAPRIVIGIWHPKFIYPARTHLPTLPLYAIVMSITEATTFFWSCDGFSMWFGRYLTAPGKAFLRRARKDGKRLCAWTVNDPWEMRECVRLGLDAVITDRPGVCLDVVREATAAATTTSSSPASKTKTKSDIPKWMQPWSSLSYFSLYQDWEARTERVYLEKEGGRFVVPSD